MKTPILFAVLSFCCFSQLFAQSPLPASDRYRIWAEQQWGSTVVSSSAQRGTVWGETADPDGDTVLNLLEYALGSDPKARNPAPKPEVLQSGGQATGFRFSITRRTDDPALAIVPQISWNLSWWLPAAPADAQSWTGDTQWFFKLPKTTGSVDTDLPPFVSESYYHSIPAGSSSRFARLIAVRNGITASTSTFDDIKLPETVTGQPGSTVESASFVATGFTGTINLSVNGGARLIVDGVDRGSSATVAANSRVFVRAATPAQANFQYTYTLNFGGLHSTTWNAISRSITNPAAVAGTPSGYTPVNAGVGQSGAAEISIPVSVPPGTAGMEPKLAITYSSQGGNGLLGVGFSLSGLSQITRTGATQFHDGFKGGINFDSKDRYMLDGQRLILASGAWGAADSEYRTEMESFSRIRLLEGADGMPYWQVKTKAGLNILIGSTANSRAMANRFANDNAVLAWHVRSINDTSGNQILFSYSTPLGLETGHRRIESIDYTANSSLTPPLNAASQVFFEYENRDDDRTSWISGAQISVRMRLRAVECRHGGVAARRYEFGYRYGSYSGDSQVLTITEKVRNPANGVLSPLPPTTFDWHINPADNQSFTTDLGPFPEYPFDVDPPAAVAQGDFNGDGLLDLWKMSDWRIIDDPDAHWQALGRRMDQGFPALDYLNPIPGLQSRRLSRSASNDGSRVRSCDINGDGFTDVFHLMWNSEWNFAAIARPTGGFRVAEEAELGDLFGQGFFKGHDSEFLMLDITGDGKSDAIYLRGSQPDSASDLIDWVRHPSWAAVGDGTGKFTKIPNAGGLAELVSGSSQSGGSWILPGDFNGDGLADLLHLYYAQGAYNWMALSNGNGTFTVRDKNAIPGIPPDGFAPATSQFLTGDFNGDGLTDILHYNNPGNIQKTALYFGKGDGGFEKKSPIVGLESGPLASLANAKLVTGDFNGDGFTDVFHADSSNPDNAWLASSNGNGTFDYADGSSLGYLEGRTYLSSHHSKVLPGDYDGDGIDDILHLRHTGGSWLLRNPGFNSKRLVKVTNGHGGSTEFIYKPLTDPAVFTKGTGSVYPCYDMIAPMHVVSTIVTRNGIDTVTTQGTSTTNYRYEKAWMCLDGRGFRGFQAIEAQNVETGIRSRTESIGTDPVLAGHPTRQVTMLANGRKIQETTSQWAYKTFTFTNGSRTDSSYFPYAQRTTEMEYDISTPSQQSPFKTTIHRGVAYDDYGNLTNSTTEWDGGYFEVTESTYLPPEVTKWWLGRLSETSVRQIQPNLLGGAAQTMQATRRSTFSYSPANGQVSEEIIDTTDAAEKLRKTYEHDQFGNITRSILEDVGTGEKRTTVTRYSNDGRFVVETANDYGHIERQTQDPLTGNVLTRTGPNGLTTSIEYDFLGRPLREHRPDGTESLTQYLRYSSADNSTFPTPTVHGVVTQRAGAAWKTTLFDVLDREIQSATPHYSGQTVRSRKVFNGKGELVQAHLPDFSGTPGIYTEFQYDEISRQKKEIAPGNRQTSTAYSGLTATVTNPVSQQFSTSADVRGRTASSTAFGSQTVTNTHDPYGNLLKVDDNRGHITSMAYNVRGFKTSMTEPNSGTTGYKYNAFGEIIEQTDALNRKTTLKYDKLGRLIERTEPEGTTVWTYDTAANGKGKLAGLYRMADGYQETYRYDSLGRPVETAYHIGNAHFVTCTTYDEYGRPHVVTYPTGFAIRNVYTSNGFLGQVLDARTGAPYWTAVSYNERGQLTEEDFGNFISSQRTYDPETGFLKTINTGNRTGGPGTVINSRVQTLSYEFNDIGNLTRRKNDNLDDSFGNRGIWEDFTYDAVNRLSHVQSNGLTPQDFTYDVLGNIKTKTGTGLNGGVAAYTYGQNGAPPMAVTTVRDIASSQVVRTLAYDAAGNCIRNGDTTITYTSSNQPATLIKGTTTLHFSYSPGRARYRQVERLGTSERTKLYIGGLYEKETDSAGNTTHTHFIPGGSGVVAIHTITQPATAAAAAKTRYVHKDHLGSIHALTREDGTIDELLYFDAWGRRLTWNATSHSFTYSTVTSQTDRGFTGHEMLDALGLVHMNGRLYDPILGRFMSVDPIVQEAGNLQNLNRYSYVLNNPLSLTDPSGFSFWKSFGKFFQKIAKPLSFLNKILYFVPGMQGVALGIDVALSFGSAFSGTLLAGGSFGDALRAGLVSGGTTYATASTLSSLSQEFGWSGADFANKYSGMAFAEKLAEKTIAHGIIGGAAEALNGGQFTHGFFSSAAAAFSTPSIYSATHGGSFGDAIGTTAAAIVGGTVSKIGGGKFANGAMSGAMGYIHNALSDGLGNRFRISGDKLIITKSALLDQIDINDFLSNKAQGAIGDYSLEDVPGGSLLTYEEILTFKGSEIWTRGTFIENQLKYGDGLISALNTMKNTLDIMSGASSLFGKVTGSLPRILWIRAEGAYNLGGGLADIHSGIRVNNQLKSGYWKQDFGVFVAPK